MCLTLLSCKSSDAAAKGLDRPMDSGSENWGPEVRDPRGETRELGTQGPRPEVRGPRAKT